MVVMTEIHDRSVYKGLDYDKNAVLCQLPIWMPLVCLDPSWESAKVEMYSTKTAKSCGLRHRTCVVIPE